MTWLCLGLVVLAVLLFIPPAESRLVGARLAAIDEALEVDLGGSGRRSWGWVGLGVGLGVLFLCYRLGRLPAVAAGVASLIVIATSARLLLQDRSLRRAAQLRVLVAHACNVLASQIRVGRVPAEALTSAACDCPVLADAARVQDMGGDVTTVWRTAATQPGQAGLADLARAWQVSARTGAPLAHSLEQVAAALTADVALRAVIAGELAAPRATGKIMAVLPLCGLGMGYLLGGDPLHFLLSSPIGWGCLVFGASLAAAGVLWIDHLSRLAGEQG